MKILLPITIRPKDREIYELLSSGRPLRSIDLLKQQFGEWPPKGTDCVATDRLEQPIVIKRFRDDKKNSLSRRIGLSIGGSGYTNNLKRDSADRENPEDDLNREIFINDRMMSGPVQTLFQCATFELWNAAAVCVAGSSLASAAPLSSIALQADALLIGLAWGSTRKFGANMLLSPLNLHAFPAYRSLADVVHHEHDHILQYKDKELHQEAICSAQLDEQPFLMEGYKNISAARKYIGMLDSVVGFNTVRNLSRDVEIQTRMHVILGRGYQKWGRLPGTREELWAAMINYGCDAPKDIKREAREALNSFKRLRFSPNSPAKQIISGIAIDTVAELNSANIHYNKLGLRDYYWRTVLPYLYGHQLELYGDPNGRAKMGFNQSRPEEISRTALLACKAG